MLQTPIDNIHRHMEPDKFIWANRWRRSDRPTRNGRMKRINEPDKTPRASKGSRSLLAAQSRRPSPCEHERVAKPNTDAVSIETYHLRQGNHLTIVTQVNLRSRDVRNGLNEFGKTESLNAQRSGVRAQLMSPSARQDIELSKGLLQNSAIRLRFAENHFLRTSCADCIATNG
jgi:hypothetical protein